MLMFAGLSSRLLTPGEQLKNIGTSVDAQGLSMYFTEIT